MGMTVLIRHARIAVKGTLTFCFTLKVVIFYLVKAK